MLILFSLIGNFVKFPIREKPSGQDAHEHKKKNIAAQLCAARNKRCVSKSNCARECVKRTFVQ